VIVRRFDEFGIPFMVDRNIVPDDDPSTLFICSGMQRVKRRFRNPDGGTLGSLQSCIRTDDLDLVGDGSHLTYFEMVGNFSFGGHDYELSVDLWHSILRDLHIPVTEIRVHPSRLDHQRLWERRGYRTVHDESCVWSDGEIGGYCCEVFCGDLEVGNLVNPLGHSTDVGFGLERLYQIIEGTSHVQRTSLFDQRYHPVVSDHLRTISIMRENGVSPGNKGQKYVCRRLMRRMLQYLSGDERLGLDDWLCQERVLREQSLRKGRRFWKKHRDKPVSFWWETFGILPDELELIGK